MSALVTPTPPPPRPSSLISPAVNEDQPPRSTKILVRWDAVGTTITTLFVGVTVGVAIATTVLGTVHAQANEDPYGGLPQCTDAIADAGGMCHGEPLPPCPTEDSDNCYWDAATMGNGRGRSFVTVDGATTYTDGAGR